MVTQPPTCSRATTIDAQRGIDPDLSLSDSSYSFSTSSPVESHIQEHLNIANDSVMTTPQKNTSLPPNWSQMSSADRDATLFTLLIENKRCISGLVSKISKISATVSGHSTRLDTLDENSRKHEQELRDLKEMQRNTPRPELKINGIPLSCTEPILNLSHKLLDYLGLQVLKSEIKRVRSLEPKDTGSAHARLSQHVTVPRSTPVTKSFVISFKTRDTVLSVLDKKSHHGKIVLSDFMPNGSDAEITVFEMLPRYTFRLRQVTRDC